MGSSLQVVDGYVQSIREVRQVYANLTDREFAFWYSARYRIDLKRVIFILEQLKGESHDQDKRIASPDL